MGVFKEAQNTQSRVTVLEKRLLKRYGPTQPSVPQIPPMVCLLLRQVLICPSPTRGPPAPGTAQTLAVRSGRGLGTCMSHKLPQLLVCGHTRKAWGVVPVLRPQAALHVPGGPGLALTLGSARMPLAAQSSPASHAALRRSGNQQVPGGGAHATPTQLHACCWRQHSPPPHAQAWGVGDRGSNEA